MYDYLVEIGLKEYLDTYFRYNEWKGEPCLERLNLFIANKSKEQKRILQKKFQYSEIYSNKRHRQINDSLNEIKIACAFHPTAIFLEEGGEEKSPDLLDNFEIEVKTINESNDEFERHSNMEPNKSYVYIGKRLTRENKKETRFKISSSIKKKCGYHLKVAAKQVKERGIIYLVYDRDLMYKQNQNFHIHAPLIDKDIKNILENVSRDFCKDYPNISIRLVSMEELNRIIEINYLNL